MRSRRLTAAIIVLGCVLALYSGYRATTGPQPRHARTAIGVIVSPGAGRAAATVSVPGPDGARFSSELRAAARRYEAAGPVNVLVVDDEPPRVYDANGRPHRRLWLLAGLGTLIVLSTVCGQRCVRVGVHPPAVKQ